MKLLFDFFPLLLFFIVFKWLGIYAATAAAMLASLLQVSAFWIKHRRFETMHLITLAVIMVFGGLTLILQDDVFIKWKPTIVYWVFALLILGSQLIGRKTALEHLLGPQINLPAPVWRRYNISWGLFFLLAGGLNIYVAFYYGLDQDPAVRQALWVNFKVFGLLGLTFLFAIVQAVFLAKHMDPENEKDAH